MGAGVSLYTHKKEHRSMSFNAIQRIRAKRNKGQGDETDDAAQALTGAVLALADEIGELRESLESRQEKGSA